MARNYVIINGKNSRSVRGLLIQELPPITKPKMRTQTVQIDGRDGEIVTPLGYEAYNKTLKIGLYGDYNADEIISFFTAQGEIIFSNEPDKKYRFSLYDEIDLERLGRFREGNISFRVEPFKYSASDGTITINQARKITFLPQVQTFGGITVTSTTEQITVAGTAAAPVAFFVKANREFFSAGETEVDVSASSVTGAVNLMYIRGENTNNRFGDQITINSVGAVPITQTGAGYFDHVYIYVPAGTVNIKFTMNRSEDGFADYQIENRGNTIAKPTVTVYGSGKINLTLNHTLISEVTIPASKDGFRLNVETLNAEWVDTNGDFIGAAYRGIVGDFAKFVFQPGVNTLDFIPGTGTITGVEISNVSRWL